MDALDRLLTPGRDLLARVDDTLVACGAPADHPLWTLLRRVGALPGDAVEAIAALQPQPLTAAADVAHGLTDAYAAPVADPGEWTGTAAQAYAARWQDLSAYLGNPGVTGRLVDTARYLAEVADWIRTARRDLAGALAEALCSAEAVRLRLTADDPPAARVAAAAAIGARVLDAVASAYDDGRALCDRWAGRLDELPYRPAASVGATSVGGTTTVPH